MSFDRHGYNFDGTYKTPEELQSHAGVYVVWCQVGESWTCLDVGESHDVCQRLKNHERSECWERNCQGIIKYAAYYTPNLQQSERLRIEQYLREKENPICGEQ